MQMNVCRALTPVAVLLLSACGAPDQKDDAKTAAAPAAPAAQTLAAALQADPSYAALSRVVTNTGLETALSGVGPYTLLAPPEAALKSSAADFTDPAVKAESAALLRALILPGAVTRSDISTAIDQSADKRVEMRTMAGGLLTFTKDGQTIVATAPDGAVVRFAGEERRASNGVLHPVDNIPVKAASAG